MHIFLGDYNAVFPLLLKKKIQKIPSKTLNPRVLDENA